ncbi:hypothetical protein BTO30_11170 [Domibacillus antri]|uniref:Uncharacterized protein n=1 Tax=Domibacillus antri TaxID=1714264 RepID=A0A1Q8Q475_9BACI|nr:hypothetical protein BTO30_11170 [Domibacillus antri]
MPFRNLFLKLAEQQVKKRRGNAPDWCEFTAPGSVRRAPEKGTLDVFVNQNDSGFYKRRNFIKTAA